ncbi:hypothetical protein [Streptomyces sp. NPDC058394]|uniref:hypothetical protein n=1 Tax=Streptomyces sp. NPDC058394 TaxID=3346477 RepID=UPI00365EBFAF
MTRPAEAGPEGTAVRITLMTADERAAISAVLGQQAPAAPALVSAACATARLLRRKFSEGKVGRLFASDVHAMAARLVAVERELAATRAVLARVIHASESRYDYSISHLAWELESDGVGIRPELDKIKATQAAEARAEGLR